MALRPITEAEIDGAAFDMADGGPTTLPPEVDPESAIRELEHRLGVDVEADVCSKETVLFPNAVPVG